MNGTKTMKNKTIEDIIKVINDGERFLITAHINPDGDSIGSQLGLYHMLKQQGKQVRIMSAGKTPVNYRFLPGSRQIETQGSVKRLSVSGKYTGDKFDVVFALDCGGISRTGSVEQYIRKIRTKKSGLKVINIDHHHDNDCFGDINWVDSAASSTGELIFTLSKTAGFKILKKTALCLYTAILTDTGSFNYANTSACTYIAAADLIETGIRPEEIAARVYQNRSVASIRLLGYVLSGLQLSDHGRLAWLKVTPDMFKKARAKEEDTEDFVNYPRSVRGVEVAVFFRQIASDNKIRVNFRSKGKVDVSKIARKFGGGGHRRASGCILSHDDCVCKGTSPASIDIVIDKVVKEIRKHL